MPGSAWSWTDNSAVDFSRLPQAAPPSACEACTSLALGAVPENTVEALRAGGVFWEDVVWMRVMIDGVFQTSGTLAAFVGDELRGVATTPVAVPFGPLENNGTVLFKMFLWVHQAEQLTWKLCDGARMIAVDPPCSFTSSEPPPNAAVGLPSFLPMCARQGAGSGPDLGPLSPFGGILDVAQYFTGTTDQCTIRAPHRATYGDETSPIHFIR